MDTQSDVTFRKSFVETAASLDPEDASVLKKVYNGWLSELVKDEDATGLVLVIDNTKVLSYWISLQKLSSLGIIEYKRITDGNIGENYASLHFRAEPGEAFEKGYKLALKFTTYGYIFTSAATGQGLLDNDSTCVVFDFDEYEPL